MFGCPCAPSPVSPQHEAQAPWGPSHPSVHARPSRGAGALALGTRSEGTQENAFPGPLCAPAGLSAQWAGCGRVFQSLGVDMRNRNEAAENHLGATPAGACEPAAPASPAAR